MNNLLNEAGENYYYVETIVKNKLELKKIEFIESVANNTGKIILAGLALITFSLVYTLFLILFTLLLAEYFDSYTIGLLIMGTIILIKFSLVAIFRKKILFKPISKLIYEKLLPTK